QEEKVVGPLVYDWKKPLPAGTKIYFNADGYAVFIDRNGDKKPRVPIFVKSTKEKSPLPSGWTEEAYRRYEYIRDRLEPGDVVFCNSRRDKQSGTQRGFFGLARL